MLCDDHHVAGFGMFQLGIKHNHRQRGQNPRPRAHGIMRDVEPKNREHTVAFVLSAEDALSDVAAAARFRSRVPERPPLQAEIHEEGECG